MSQITEIYAGELAKDPYRRSLFLAGPTPRHYSQAKSWRPKMLSFLEKYGFIGDVFIPELRGYVDGYEAEKMVSWEVRHLHKADVIAFWVPRQEGLLPGFTTNIEYGEFMGSGKAVLGYPENADSIMYLRKRAEMFGDVPIFGHMGDMALHLAQRFKKIDLNQYGS